ncbi:hypothetical protein [Nocardia sp. NPDC057272]|uniref:hypothetical protein n=1 Tax=Nocardia sp. NPDC057272 TaxID=3346079 RepID=UPI003635F507
MGTAELVSRYRDEPQTLFGVASAWVYVILNACGSVAAIYLARTFDWTFGTDSEGAKSIMQVLVAGLGASAFLRSSFFNVKMEGRTVPVGPSAVLTSLLAAADRGVDRFRAKSRSESVTRIMKGISFEEVQAFLPTFGLALLQNVPTTEQKELRSLVDALSASKMADSQKSFTLGLLLMDVFGPAALEATVTAFKESVRTDDSEVKLADSAGNP